MKHENSSNITDTLLELSKGAFDESELTRRIEWIRIVCEEKLQEELNREKELYQLISFLLVATSFIIAPFATYLFEYSKITAKSKWSIIITIFAGLLLLGSLFLELVLVFYKKRLRFSSVSEITASYLDKTVLFDNPYSENYGRILYLDTCTNSLNRKNSFAVVLERITIVLLMLFIIMFSLCLVLLAINGGAQNVSN